MSEKKSRRGLLKVGAAVLASMGVVAGVTLTICAAPRDKERHPHLQAALHELREAKRELQKADHDFCGHRVQALKAIDEAVGQLEKVLKHDHD